MASSTGGLNVKLKNNIRERLIRLNQPYELSDEVAEQLQATATELDRQVFRIRPYPEDGGIYEAVDLLEHFHETRTRWGWLKNVSDTHAYELWYNSGGDGRLTFNLSGNSRSADAQYRDQFYEEYPNTTITEAPTKFPEGALESGQSIAGARLKLFREPYHPMEHVDIGGFSSDDGQHRDPYKDILSSITRDNDCQVVLQILFRPIATGPISGLARQFNLNTTADTIESDKMTFGRDMPITTRSANEYEQSVAEVIRGQISSAAQFQVEGRVFVSAPDGNSANDRLQDVCHKLKKYYQTDLDQGLYGVPVNPWWRRSSKVKQFAQQVVGRERHRHKWIECSNTELAGLVHLPEEEVNNAAIDWSLTKAGRPVATGTPRIDWEKRSDKIDDAEEATEHEKQRALFETTGQGDPFMFGFGARKGIEAGVEDEVFKTHAFVGGSTGKGKTQLLIHIWRQFLDQDAGGLFFDPKGDDGDKILQYTPEDRDDVVYVEIGGDREQEVRMNFLEVPTDAEPGTDEFEIATESMTSDVKALIAEAGAGDIDYWGPAMDRIAGNMIRGLARLGEDCTLYDLYVAVGSEEGRQRYGDAVSDQKVDFIEDYAQQIAEMDDDKVDAITGRLAQWVENGITRRIISSPESTFSVREAVKKGQPIVVSDKTPEGVDAGKMIATALIRRIWMAIREQTKDGERPPMFYAILDEFDKIASSNSNIATLLSIARSSNLSIIPACQDLTNQIDDEEIMNAILGQCNTFLNFNPRRFREAQEIARRHSDDVSASDLTNMSKYTIYMRTHTDRDTLSYSYKVNTFAPLDEIAPDLVRSQEGVEELKRQSDERHADEPLTNEEIKRRSAFDVSVSDISNDGAGLTDEGLESISENIEEEIIETTHRLCIQKDVEKVPVPLVRQTVAENVDFGEHILAQQLEKVAGGDNLEVTKDGDVMYASVTSDGRQMIFDTGSAVTGGKAEHRWGLRHTYNGLLKLGFEMDLPQQDGNELPDAVGHLPVEQGGDTLEEAEENYELLLEEHPEVEELSDATTLAIEFESKSLTKPSQVLKNLTKTVSGSEQRVLYMVSQGDTSEGENFTKNAEKLVNILRSPPMTADATTDADRMFYRGNPHKVEEVDGDDVFALHPDPNATVKWVEIDGEILAWKGNKGERSVVARFDSVEEFENQGKTDFPAVYRHDSDSGEYVVWHGGEEHRYTSKEGLKDEWSIIYTPFIPEVELEDYDREQLGGGYDDRWRVGIVPDDIDNDGASTPLQYYDPDEEHGVSVYPMSEVASQEPLLKNSPEEPQTTDDAGTGALRDRLDKIRGD